MELCRLVSILFVMLVHTTKQSLGDDMSLGALILEGFTIIGVDVFILLSGFFSATPKKTSFFNLAFICFFWMVIKLLCLYECGEPITYEHLFFMTNSNWFIVSYIQLLFLAPILNIFANSVSGRTLWGVVIALFLIQIWFDWIPPYPGGRASSDFSILSFIFLYLLARAIRLYGLPQWFMKKSPLIYVSCSVLLGIGAYSLDLVGLGRVKGLCFSYINPVVIISAVAFVISFLNYNFQSKIVNHLAKSTLALLLGHKAIFFLYTKQFKYLYDHFSGITVVAYWALAVAIVFCASIAIDQIRLLLYKPIEKWMKMKIKNNNFFDLPVGKRQSVIK